MPDSIARHPSVKSHAQQLGTRPQETLLDRSYHHAAMKAIDGAAKRGRPDIVHFALMEALSTPLYIDGYLSVYVHTAANKVIRIETDNLRVPKSYFRFEGLMVDLFRKKIVETDDGSVLMRLDEMTFGKLLDSIESKMVVGLSTTGIRSTAQEIASRFAGKDLDCVFVVGGFPRGHFSENTTSRFNFTYSISEIGLEAHVVIARILYECEKALGIYDQK